MQALVNAAAVNLTKSGFKCKCVPAAVCVLKKEQLSVDPSLQQMSSAESKLFAVVDADKEEFIYSELKQQTVTGLELDEVERLMGLALSSGKAVHGFMLKL